MGTASKHHTVLAQLPAPPWPSGMNVLIQGGPKSYKQQKSFTQLGKGVH